MKETEFLWLANTLGPSNHNPNLLERPALLLDTGWAFQHGMQLRIFVLMCISTFFKGMRDLCLQETVNGWSWCVMISAYPRSYILGHTHLYTDTNTHIHGVTCTNSYKPTYKSHMYMHTTHYTYWQRDRTQGVDVCPQAAPQ